MHLRKLHLPLTLLLLILTSPALSIPCDGPYEDTLAAVNAGPINEGLKQAVRAKLERAWRFHTNVKQHNTAQAIAHAESAKQQVNVANLPTNVRQPILDDIDTLIACLRNAPTPVTQRITVQVVSIDSRTGEPSAVGTETSIRANGETVGNADKNGTITFSANSGLLTISAERYGTEFGTTTAEVTPDAPLSITVRMYAGKSTPAPSTLMIAEAVDGVVPATTPTITLRFLEDQKPATITRLEAAELIVPGQTTSITAELQISKHGDLEVAHRAPIDEIIEAKAGPFSVHLIAFDKDNRRHEGTTTFHAGRYTINGTVRAATPRYENLYIRAEHYESGLVFWTRPSSTGRFTFEHLPEGYIEITGHDAASPIFASTKVTLYENRDVELVLVPPGETPLGTATQATPSTEPLMTGTLAKLSRASHQVGAQAIVFEYVNNELIPTSSIDLPEYELAEKDPTTRKSAREQRSRERIPVLVTAVDEHGKSIFEDVVALRIPNGATPAVVVRVPKSAHSVRLVPVGGTGNEWTLDALRRDETLRLAHYASTLEITSATPEAVAVDNSLDVVVLSEGYQLTERPKFDQHANQVINHFDQEQPYANYAAFMTFRPLFKASTDSGADHPPCADPFHPDPGRPLVNTAFDATYCTGGLFRVLFVDTAKVFTYVEAQTQGKYDSIIVLVNDTDHGGSGRSGIAVSSVGPGMSDRAAHEFGHSFTELGDEYEDPGVGVACTDLGIHPDLLPCEPNTTYDIGRTTIKWGAWIAATTPLPTTSGSMIGAFEGARYQATGYYRPAQTCKMRDSGTSFCDVCKEAFVRRLYDGQWGKHSSGIRILLPNLDVPTPGPVSIQTGTPTKFSVSAVNPIPALTIEWFLDGVKIPGATAASYTFPAATPGRYTLKVIVRDDTPFVRRRLPSMEATREWTLLVGTVVQLQAAGKDQLVEALRLITVPQGQKTLEVQYEVTTAEYPTRTYAGTPYDDQWFICVYPKDYYPNSYLLSFCESNRYVSEGDSHNSYARPPLWNANGRTGIITISIDVSGITATATVVFVLQAGVENNGDAYLPTSILAQVVIPGEGNADPCSQNPPPPSCDPCNQKPPAPECNVNVTIERLTARSLPTSDSQSDSTYYSIPNRGNDNHYIRTAELKIQKNPATAKLTRVKVELLSKDGTLLSPVLDLAPGNKHIETVGPNEYRVRITFGRFSAQAATVPPPAHDTKYRFTVYIDQNGKTAQATADVGTVYSDYPRGTSPMTRLLHALWRMPAGIPRFAPAIGNREDGGDDWCSKATYGWLDNHRELLTAVDDISGEHSRFIGQPTHDFGTEIDIEPADLQAIGTEGEYLALRLNAGLAFEVENQDPVISARAREAFQNVRRWTDRSREHIDRLLATDTIQEVRYLTGDLCPNESNPAWFITDHLPAGWAANLLRDGRITDTQNRTLELFLPSWSNRSNERLFLDCTHKDRVHLTLDRCRIGEIPPPCSNRRRPVRPTITTNPTSTTITEGEAASLLVQATADEALVDYWWYEGDTGDMTTPLGRGESITVRPTATTTYWAAATSTGGTAYSSPATVTVIPACAPPSIRQQPQAGAIIDGDTFTLAVTALSTTATTYQWYVGPAGDTAQPILDATGFAIAVTPYAATTYWVRVTNACGSTNSTATTIVVTERCSSPQLRIPPEGTRIVIGASASLSVFADGTAPITYQWYAGEPGDTSAALTGERTTSLSVTPTVTTTYWVRVSNACGIVNSTGATVEVCHPPSITTSPQDATITAGDSITLSVQASNATSYEWYAAPINQAPYSLPGETTSSLTVAPTTSTHYWVVATGPCGTAMGQGALITVISCAPTIIVPPADQRITAGEEVTLEVVATITGGGTLTYQWYETPAGLDAWTPITGGTAETITIRPAVGETWFRVTVSSACQSIDSDIAAVTAVMNCDSPSITQDLPAELHIAYNQTTTLAITASGTALLAYQWYELQLYQGIRTWHELPGATNPSVDVIGAVEGALYYVEVSNDCGIIQSSTVKVIGDKDPVLETLVATYHVTRSGERLLDDAIVTFTNQTKLKGHPQNGDRVKAIIERRHGKSPFVGWIEKLP